MIVCPICRMIRFCTVFLIFMQVVLFIYASLCFSFEVLICKSVYGLCVCVCVCVCVCLCVCCKGFTNMYSLQTVMYFIADNIFVCALGMPSQDCQTWSRCMGRAVL